MKVASLSHPGSTRCTSDVPNTTPGARPRVVGRTRRQTCGTLARLTQRTYAFRTTSTHTSAGLRIRLDEKSRATGAVIEENPYPNAPFTVVCSMVFRIKWIPLAVEYQSVS